MTLEDCVDKISCPVLLMNATGDSSFPASEAEILREKIRGPVEVMYFERRGHGGPPSLAWPMAADWIADRLGVAGV